MQHSNYTEEKEIIVVERSFLVHFLAGGCGGCVSAIVCNPIEVVKTRLQSSFTVPKHPGSNGTPNKRLSPQSVYKSAAQKALPIKSFPNFRMCHLSGYMSLSVYHTDSRFLGPVRPGLLKCLRVLMIQEGAPGLFRGLLASLVGMIPSRAITLGTNQKMKQVLKKRYPNRNNTVMINGIAGSIAGFAQHSLTNPIWFVRTRLQLDCSTVHKLTVSKVCQDVYRRDGLRGFFRGVTASYLGIPEIAIMLVTYEELKRLAAASHTWQQLTHPAVTYMLFSGVSKIFASTLAYPHEVIRTRLREGNPKYQKLWKTISLLAREEGIRGLYGGLNAQLVRQFPNTMITFLVYEYGTQMWENRQRRLFQETISRRSLCET